MNSKLIKWILDSMSVDMQTTYRHQQQLAFEFEFINRYDDYYINLLTRMLNILNGEYNNINVNEELLAIARGLIVFNSKSDTVSFEGVNKNENILYVSAIFYLCDYEAIANLIVQDCDFKSLNTESSRIIYFIVSGGQPSRSIDDYGIIDYLIEGDSREFEKFMGSLHLKNKAFNYESVNDFFDSQLLEHVLNKFAITNLRADLVKNDLNTNWNEYIRFATNKHIFSFLLSQREAIDKGLLSFKRSFSLKMPTSAGKSFITELLIYQEIKNNPDAKVLYLAPLRSLSHELKLKYGKISKALGFTYRCIYGGSSITITETFLKDADMLITTPETLMSLEGSDQDLLSLFTLVICDEGQLLESTTRGLDYELLLSRLRKYEEKRFLFISAIIPNIGEINTWLGGSEVEVGDSKYRPCSIRFGKAIESNGAIDLEIYENLSKAKLFTLNDFVDKKDCSGMHLSTQMIKACLLALKSLNAGAVMLFTSFKNGNAGCERYGNKVLDILNKGVVPSPLNYLNKRQLDFQKEIEEYVKYQFGIDYYQSKFVSKGYAVHHGSIPQDIREIIETGYSKGAIRMVICNSTLAEGVNFPVKTIVLGDIRHPTGHGYMDKEVLMNVIGRAGRAGEETYGLVISSDRNFEYVIQAGQGNGLSPARGMLNDVVSFILLEEDLLGEELTDQEINEMLDNRDLSNPIDKMILLVTENAQINQNEVEEISSSSLTFHLADERKRKGIKRVFAARSNYLKSLSPEELSLYKAVGLTPEKNQKLVKLNISKQDISNITIDSFCTFDWLKWFVDTVGVTENIDNPDIVTNILFYWMAGLQYVEIAKKLSVSVEEVVGYIDWIQKDFLLSSKSILNYFCIKYEVDSDIVSVWQTFLEKGINSRLQLDFLYKGLFDRIAIHKISDFVKATFKNGDKVDMEILHTALKNNKERIDAFLFNEQIPAISMKRVDEFIKG